MKYFFIDTIESICINKDATELFSAAWDNKIIMWDIKTGKKLKIFAGHSGKILIIIEKIC